MLPRVVTKKELIPANGIISSANSANMLGSNVSGGLLVALLGLGIPFEYDALSFLIAVILIAALPRDTGRAEPLPEHKESQGDTPSFWREFTEGMVYLRKDRLFLRLTIMGAVVSFFAMGLQGLYAPYVQFNLQGGPAVYGFFNASFAAGAMVGGLVVGRFGRSAQTGILILVGLLGQAVAIVGLSFNHLAIAALALWAFCGVAQMVNIIPFQSLMQAKIPSKLFGRVSSIMSAVTFAPAPIAIMLTSTLAVHLSIGFMLLAYGMAMAITVLVTFGSSPQWQTLDIKDHDGQPAKVT